MSRALASPFGILIILPSLVFGVGLFLALVGYAALKGSNTALGQKRLDDQVKLVAMQLRGALGQADPLLDQLAGFALQHDPAKPITPAAMVMGDLISARPGVAYVSVSFPDGTFQGAYRELDGQIHFQDSRVSSSGTKVLRYAYAGHAAVTVMQVETTTYDPRERGFYKLALETGQRAWTEPYPFFQSWHTGVTRTFPLFKDVNGTRQLHAVLTVDFDINALSEVLRSAELPNMHTLLFTHGGAILAYPQGERRIAGLPLDTAKALSYHDLKDPILDAFFSRVDDPKHEGQELKSFEVSGGTYVSSVAKVRDDLNWRVAYLVPEQVFFESLHNYQRRSFAIAGLAVLLALGVSIAFARLVVSVRQEAAAARAAAQRANQAARELGSYRLTKCLGKGGMGEVWRAEHRLLAREAAIKLIRLEDGADSSAEAQERFRREAQTLASLRSRNTIELFDYGVADDGTFFYVMELLDGLDLESLVANYGTQTPGRVVHLLMQACRSLGEAHEAGLVHRDVKPANLFVCRAADEVDVVKVLDFGLVRDLSAAPEGRLSGVDLVHAATAPGVDAAEIDSNLTQAGSVMGTPEFMAPEQAQGKPLDGRADIYALGCVAYWLLAGRPVFQKSNTMQLLVAHMCEEPAPLEQTAGQPVPAALAAVVMACLAKAPEARPQLASELWRRLAEVQQSLPAEALWTEERAQLWWQKHQPAATTALPVSMAPTQLSHPPVRIQDASG